MGTVTDTVTATDNQRISRGPSVRLQRILAFILLLAQGGITVTGSIVRVTGSGLGCDTWPNCHEGSLVPVAGAAPAIHQAIEFGNRLLTFVLAAIALAVFIAVYRAGRRREIKTYAWISGLGIILQAVIGGMSVILDLQWWAVAIHFLPSMILVWIAALLYMRLAEPDHGRPVRMFPELIRTLTVVAAVALALVLITGTMTTGAGVHSGDAGVGMEGRLEVDIKLMAYIHAGAMYLYLAATLVVTWLLHRHKAPTAARQTAYVLIAMIIVQWGIGLIQFYLGIPRWTIPVHIAMSSVVVAFSAFLYAHGLRRTVDTPALKAHTTAAG
jgi:heme a synthase